MLEWNRDAMHWLAHNIRAIATHSLELDNSWYWFNIFKRNEIAREIRLESPNPINLYIICDQNRIM